MFILASLSAVRNSPYWSCIMSAVAFSVRLSIPIVFRISACVSFIFSQLLSAHSPSTSSERLRVALPDFILVRVTRYVASPILKVNLMLPLLASSALLIQPLMSPSLVSSNRQSHIASIKSDDFPAPFSPLMVQKRMLSKLNVSSR